MVICQPPANNPEAAMIQDNSIVRNALADHGECPHWHSVHCNQNGLICGYYSRLVWPWITESAALVLISGTRKLARFRDTADLYRKCPGRQCSGGSEYRTAALSGGANNVSGAPQRTGSELSRPSMGIEMFCRCAPQIAINRQTVLCLHTYRHK